MSRLSANLTTRLGANLAPWFAPNLAPGFSANFPPRLAADLASRLRMRVLPDEFAFLARKAACRRHVVLLHDRLAPRFRHPDVGLHHDVLLRLPFAR
jgi:hypothetical protein